MQYAYDSQNKRVWAATVDGSNNLGGQTLNFYGVNGQLIGTYALSVIYGRVNPIADWPLSLAVYFGSKRIATIQSGTSTYWQDRLGSNRTNASRYYPWGEDRGTPSNDQVRFATYTRDSATLLDYADQRYYGNAQGRFMTPDPYQASGGPSDPGSWNRYAYTVGDPVNRRDPAGLIYEECGGDVDGSCGGGGGGGGGDDPNGYCDPSTQDCGNSCVGADGFTPMPGPSCEGQDPGQSVQTQGCYSPTSRYTYVCLGSTGPQVGEVQGDLQWLAEYIDLNCLQWLNLASGKAYDFLTGINVGVANSFNYLGGGVANNIGATTDDLGYGIIVNASVFFFTPGNPPFYQQIATLIHEVAHLTGAAGSDNDSGGAPNGGQNGDINAAIDQNCAITLKAAGK